MASEVKLLSTSEVKVLPTSQVKLVQTGETLEGNEAGDEISNDASLSGSESLSSRNAPSKGGVDPKVCGVCGDKALGNNFNAITCESCKAFFRRNALRTKEFVCPFSNNCKVDAVTRRFCQRCRLKKCFDIGMKKEWIMTDEEKKLKKQKIEQNRLKRTSFENSRGGHSNELEQNLADSPPAAKVHITEEHHAHHHRSSANHGGVIQGEVGGDNPKIHKQPMMPHNPNYSTSVVVQPATPHLPATTPPPSRRLDGSGDNGQKQSVGGGRDNRSHVIAITVNNQQVIKDKSVHPSPSSSAWLEGAPSEDSSSSSSSSTSSHPPPLVKPPNKRHLQDIYMSELAAVQRQDQEGVGEDGTGSASQMPLLSSLIRPGMSESPSSEQSVSSPTEPVTYDTVDTPSLVEGAESNSVRQQQSPTYPVPLPPPTHHQHSPENQQQIQTLPPTSPESPQSNYYDHSQQHHHHHHHFYVDEHGGMMTSGRGVEEEAVLHPSEQFEMEQRLNEYQERIMSKSINSKSLATSPCISSQQNPQSRRHDEVENERRRREDVMPLPLNTMDSILSVAIAAEFNAFSMLGGNLNSKELNKAEQAKLNELLLASQALHAPVDAERPIKVSETSDSTLINVINLTEIAIRRLIKMSKKISGFKNMCQEDQIALLKGGCTEMMILRSVVTYDPDRDSWQIPHSNPGYNINLGVLKEARGNLYEEHQRFVKSFRSQWRQDENIMIILCAITLFTPERLNVIHKDVVKLEQDSYYYLLKRYLESILNGCEAKSTYLQLIRKIAELRALNSNHVRVFLEVNPKEVEPLLIEIFDLK